jgi:hypothetical protein
MNATKEKAEGNDFHRYFHRSGKPDKTGGQKSNEADVSGRERRDTIALS